MIVNNSRNMQEWFDIQELVQIAGDELFTFKCLGLCPERHKTLKVYICM
jgi:hypothetical protein